MIVREPQIFEDIYDYAVWLGAWTSAEGKPMDNVFFGVHNLVADECRRLYELAYDMEEQEGILYSTAIHEHKGRLVTWDEPHGQGSALFDIASGWSAYISFDYTVLEDGQRETELLAGEPLKITWRWTDGSKREAIKVERLKTP